MSKWHVDRALFQLVQGGRLSPAWEEDPEGALDVYDLEPDERQMLLDCDVAEMYRRGVHPNLIRNFSATLGVDYLARYRQAGL
jgi:hypothetical protein